VKTLVYYYEGFNRIAIGEVETLPEVGSEISVFGPVRGRVVKVVNGCVSDYGHCYTRIDVEVIK
jgi:hypothetical protein